MRNKIAFFTIVAVLMVVPSAFGAIAPCSMGTYSTYAVVGFSCSINGLVFDTFSYASSADPTGVTIFSSGITVTPITTLGNEGFQFNIGSNVKSETNPARSNFQDEILLFRVSTADGSATITNLTLFFNGSITGTGITNVTENYCLNSNTLSPCAQPGQIKVTNPPEHFNDIVPLGAGVSSLYVSKDINATAGINGTASISLVSNTFTHGVVPEPLTTVLVGAGLVGIGLMRRYRKVKKA